LEKENLNTQINYKVKKAGKEQTDIISEKFYNIMEEKNISVVFVAIDEVENIVGYLVAEEKTTLNGTDWWIWNIFTCPEHRRQGIGTALLKETIKHAEQKNIGHLQGSCTDTPAHLFWFKNNFCFIKYGQKLDNENYSHMIFYRIDKTEKVNSKEHEDYRIIKAEKEQADCIFDKYILIINQEYYKDKKDDIFVFVAVDEDKNILGFITALADEMYEPLDGTVWLIPYIFVRPEFRRQGIGSALVKEIVNSAKESNITQLTAIKANDALEFWRNNNFDIFYWSAVGKVNTAIVAGLRIL